MKPVSLSDYLLQRRSEDKDLSEPNKNKYEPTHLQLKHHIHLVATQRTDVIQDQCCDDVNAVGLMSHYTCLRHTNTHRKSMFTLRSTMSPMGLTFPCLRLPGSPGRGPGSTLLVSPVSAWSGGRSIHWCRGQADPDLPWCFHTWYPETAGSHTPSCSWSCYSGSAESSENKRKT